MIGFYSRFFITRGLVFRSWLPCAERTFAWILREVSSFGERDGSSEPFHFGRAQQDGESEERTHRSPQEGIVTRLMIGKDKAPRVMSRKHAAITGLSAGLRSLSDHGIE